MLVTEGGETRGTLGGGCVEAEVRLRALRQLPADACRLLTFKLDDNYGWDDGLVCGGTMEVAVATLGGANAANPYRRARELVERGETATLHFGTFEQVIRPPPTLIIAGAGHVGEALATLAASVDFDVVVVDDRPDCASEARFPSARRIVGDIERELGRLRLTAASHVVIVTRGHRHDASALRAVVNSAARYIGLIGSKRKIIEIFKLLRAEGVPTEALTKVHAPIGLDLGGTTPGEIAVSIAAELVAVRRGGSAARDAMRIDHATLDRTLNR